MREILFRAKQTDNGEWVEGSLIKSVWMDSYGYITKSQTTDLVTVFLSTVGQYTGLTDKNGKKIFEGDIIKYSEPEILTGVYKVVYAFGFFSPFDCISTRHCEVIGNIHDNPELLEGA